MKKIVIGLGFGDEGKGAVTDWLARKDKKQSVVRYCGGHNAGHNVWSYDHNHIFSNFGSGTLQGLPTIWKASTCDPVGFMNEYQLLIDFNPQIWIDPLTPVTTPFDKGQNQNLELKQNHGSMGVGFGTTIQREEDNYHLYFQDLFHEELLNAKLLSIIDYYNSKGIVIGNDSIQHFLNACKEMIEVVDQTERNDYDNAIYESSQGIMLDMDYGIFPNVTRDQVGTQKLHLKQYDELYLVTRAYQTRHGNGWCSRHGYTPYAPEETNMYNEWQGDFKTRLLDLDLLIYAINIDKGIRTNTNKNLVITCLDQMKSFALTHNNKRIDFDCEADFIDYIIEILPNCKNVYCSHNKLSELKEW